MIFDIIKNNIDTITGFGIIATFIFNTINLKKISKDNEPQLLFDLRNFHGDLILTIKNTGKTKATDIKVNIKKLHNNSDKILNEDFLFCIPFELSTNEQTQGKIAAYAGTYYDKVFPYIDIEVSYKKPHNKKEVKYERQVFFNPQTVNEFDTIAESVVSMKKGLEEIKNPLTRLANYFDGCQIAPFDEINILAGTSFQNDLSDALNNKKNKMKSREESIQKRLKH